MWTPTFISGKKRMNLKNKVLPAIAALGLAIAVVVAVQSG